MITMKTTYKWNKREIRKYRRELDADTINLLIDEIRRICKHDRKVRRTEGPYSLIHGEVACYDCGYIIVADDPRKSGKEYAFRPGVIELVFDGFDANNRFLFRGDNYHSFSTDNWNAVQAASHNFIDTGNECDRNYSRCEKSSHPLLVCSKCDKPRCEALLHCYRK